MALRQLGIGCGLAGMAVTLCMTLAWPSPALAQQPNFHPCNAQPALPICQHGYGRRVAAARWGAKPAPLDPDAGAKAALVTQNPAQEIEKLKSTSILVADMDTAEILFDRNADVVRPVASIVKLMTALVVVDAGLALDEMITIARSDVDVPSDLPSRLAPGTRLSRRDLLQLALASSENSAAHALGRTYPDGMSAFVEAMNAQAQALGMHDTVFVEPVGLSNDNVSSAHDLVRLVQAAALRPLIRAFTSAPEYQVDGRTFHNTNMLVGRPQWDIQVSKTGTTREAGDCLVMMVRLDGHDLAMVLLNAQGMSGARFGDAVRLRRVLDRQMTPAPTPVQVAGAP